MTNAYWTTLKVNRAFYGWGHRFLYSKEMLKHILGEMKYIDIRFCKHGESDNPDLRNLEKHSLHGSADLPGVIVVETTRGQESISPSSGLLAFLQDNYISYTTTDH